MITSLDSKYRAIVYPATNDRDKIRWRTWYRTAYFCQIYCNVTRNRYTHTSNILNLEAYLFTIACVVLRTEESSRISKTNINSIPSKKIKCVKTLCL